MIIEKKDCNFWDEVYNENGNAEEPYDAIVCDITKSVRGNGMLVMETGIEQEFKERFEGLCETWGHRLVTGLNADGVMCNPTFLKRKNQPEELEGNVDLTFITAFPTREEFKNTPDKETISLSCEVMKKLVDTMGWDRVLMSAPSNIDWEEIKPIFVTHFDTRFTVVINE